MSGDGEPRKLITSIRIFRFEPTSGSRLYAKHMNHLNENTPAHDTGTAQWAPFIFINCPNRDRDGFLGAPTGLFYAVGPLVESIRSREIDCPPLSLANFFDPVAISTSESDLASLILQIKPVLVGFSQTSESHHIALQLARVVRHYCGNEALIVFGGPHEDEVSFNPSSPDHTLARFPDLVDVVVSGDGEYALKQIADLALREQHGDRLDILSTIVQSKETFRKTEGRGSVFVSVDGKVVGMPLSGKAVDLNGLPTLHYDLIEPRHFFDYRIFRRNDGEIKKCVQLMTHRGCRSACVYCTERGSFSGKSVEKTIEEILELRVRHGIEAVFFDDSTFNEENGFVESFCRSLIDLGLTDWLEWGCLTRFDSIDPNILSLMSEAGCTYCYFGLEMFDSATLRSIGKATTEAAIDSAMEMLLSAKLRVGVSVLFGIGESWNAVDKTIDFVNNWIEAGVIHVVSLSANCFHPNSAQTRRLGRSKAFDYSRRPPHFGAPWNCFEEGMWYHPEAFDEQYAWRVLEAFYQGLCKPDVLVRCDAIERALSRRQLSKLPAALLAVAPSMLSK